MLINRFKKIIAVVIAAAIIPAALGTPAAVRADDTVDSAAIIADALANGAHRCNVNAPRSGNVFVQLFGTFDTTSSDAILNQLNSYRLEACQNGYRERDYRKNPRHTG